MTKQAELQEVKQVATEEVGKRIEGAVADLRQAGALVPVSPADQEKPIFNGDELSWDDSQELALLQPRINKAAADNDYEAMAKAMADLRTFLSRITVSIPRSWLVKRAPENLDWSNPASFGYIKSSKSMAVAQAMNEAIAGDSDPKNVSAS